MRTRSGPKRLSEAQKVRHLIEGAEDHLVEQKKSIFDAIRKLTSGPVADDWHQGHHNAAPQDRHAHDESKGTT